MTALSPQFPVINAFVDLESIAVSANEPVGPDLGGDAGGPSGFQFSQSVGLESGNLWRLRVKLTGPAPDPGVFVHITSSPEHAAPLRHRFVPIIGGEIFSDVVVEPAVVNEFISPVEVVTITASLGSTQETATLLVVQLP